jgi:syntaxin 8
VRFLFSDLPLWYKQGLIEQDQYLDLLSHSINRQHHMSLQINEELDVHSNLLEELDTQLDRTEGRLGRARRSLDKVARGVKNNGLFSRHIYF